MSRAENGRHELIVDTLERRLREKGMRDINKHLRIKIRNQHKLTELELDLFAIRNGHARYYEVKSTDNRNARARAYDQFYRANKFYQEHKDIFGIKDFKCVYVTPTKVFRYRP